MSISRRNMLIGSGAAVTLGACCKTTPDCPSPPSPSFRTKDFQEGWNKGDRPWEDQYTVGHGEHGPLMPFRTTKICLIYMDVSLNPFGLDVARFHFDAAAEGSEWTNVEREVTEWINRLNALPFPTAGTGMPPWKLENGAPANKYWLGLSDFAFNQQHHVIIYFKTKGLDFNPRHPLWFGDTLQGKVLGHGDDEHKADWNYSFYGAGRKIFAVTSPTDYADAVIYMRNHYQKRGGASYQSLSNEIGKEDRRVYSLNINVITHTKVGNLEVPLIIDPDTGNMGGGQP